MSRRAQVAIVAGAMLALAGPSANAQVTIQSDDVGSYGAHVDALAVSMDVSPAGGEMFFADLAVSIDREVVFETRIEELFSVAGLPVVQIAEIDPGNAGREVFVSHYSGGAHCCNLVSAITQDADGQWVEVEVGQFDGGPLPDNLRDLDGDGLAEFLTHDSRFLYQFASYAGSTAPPRILGVRGAKTVDLTADPAFDYVVRSALNRMSQMPDDGEARNSWLATYTALQLLLGDDQPFARAQADHAGDVTWGMEYCVDASVAIYDCPDDKKAVRAFPEALRLFLRETGYLE